MEVLGTGRITFYDPTTFSGWPVFQFYGFLPALLAALVGLISSPFFAAPAVFGVHLVSITALALLPCSLSCTLRAISPKTEAWRLALVASLYSFWFINHDGQWFGVGGAAVLNIGLFAQVFGWHGLLWYFTLLIKILNGDSKGWHGLAITIALLAVSHLLTLSFCILAGTLLSLWTLKNLKLVILAHVVGLLLVSFWFVPFIIWVGDYTPFDYQKHSGDLISLLFRYSLSDLWSIVTTFPPPIFDLVSIMNVLLAIALIVLPSIRRNIQISSLVLVTLLLTVAIQSDLFCVSLPLGIHYYRFNGYLMLLSIVSLAAVLIELRWAATILVPVIAIAFMTTVRLPHYEWDKILQSRDRSSWRFEEQVLNYFKQLPDHLNKGRVYFEYLTDYAAFRPLSAHYLASRLYEDTGFEPIHNSFIQSSLSYRYVTASVALLGGTVYAVPTLLPEFAHLDDQTILEQLRSFGITHIVGGTTIFKERLEKLLGHPPEIFGPYWIFEIAASPPPKISESAKTPVAITSTGPVSFHLLDLYRYGRKDLYSKLEFLSASTSDIPLKFSGQEQLAAMKSSLKTFNHYSLKYPWDPEYERFRTLVPFLDQSSWLTNILKNVISSPPPASSSPTLKFTNHNQAIVLNGLRPKHLYRLNYSYTPRWQSDEGEVLRGSEERIFVVPEHETMTLHFSRLAPWPMLVGLILSVLSLGGFIITARNVNRGA